MAYKVCSYYNRDIFHELKITTRPKVWWRKLYKSIGARLTRFLLWPSTRHLGKEISHVMLNHVRKAFPTTSSSTWLSSLFPKLLLASQWHWKFPAQTSAIPASPFTPLPTLLILSVKSVIYVRMGQAPYTSEGLKVGSEDRTRKQSILYVMQFLCSRPGLEDLGGSFHWPYEGERTDTRQTRCQSTIELKRKRSKKKSVVVVRLFYTLYTFYNTFFWQPDFRKSKKALSQFRQLSIPLLVYFPITSSPWADIQPISKPHSWMNLPSHLWSIGILTMPGSNRWGPNGALPHSVIFPDRKTDGKFWTHSLTIPPPLKLMIMS